MAEPTEHIGLHKSELDDHVSLAQDFNTNWDLIDAYVGAAKGSLASIAARLLICLANSGGIRSGETFPGSPTLGQLFYKSDTEILYIRSADSWDQIGISDHGALGGLGDDDHSQYLINSRHDLIARHTLGSVVPHDTLADLVAKAHSSLTGVTAAQHHAKAVSSDIDHGGVGGLGDDDHGQYLNNARHDTTTRHPVSVIKTASGSAIGTINDGNTLSVTMHRKSFFPTISTEIVGTYMELKSRGLASDPNDYIGRFAIDNNTGANRSYFVRWDYLSASGPPLIWVIPDKEGHIVHCWEAQDPSDPKNLSLCPIELVDMEGRRFGEKPIRIILPSNLDVLVSEATKAKIALSELIIKHYQVNLKTRKLER